MDLLGLNTTDHSPDKLSTGDDFFEEVIFVMGLLELVVGPVLI